MVSGGDKSKIFIAKFAPIFSTAILCGISNKLRGEFGVDVIAFDQNITLGFFIDSKVIKNLFLLNFIWLIFAFYSEKFFIFNANKNIVSSRLFFILFIAFSSLIIVAKNLVTLLLAYDLLILSYYFLLTKFLFKNKNYGTKIFSFFILLEAFLLFCATILAAKLGAQNLFSQDGVLSLLNGRQTIFLFGLFSAAILSTILSSSYLLFHKNFNFDPPLTYLALPVFFSFGKVFILIKIITEVFSIGAFIAIIAKTGFTIFEIIFLLNLLVSLTFLLFSRDFKAIFFHLFFTQLIFVIFTIFASSLFNEGLIGNILQNFILTVTLIFLTFSNLILYLKNAQNKELDGLFYNMKINIALMLFGFLNLLGLVPTAVAFEKFSLLKIVWQNNLVFSQIIFASNFLGIFLLMIKLFYPFFLKQEDKKSDHDKQLALKIDSASSLTLAALVLAVIMGSLSIIQFFYD